MLFLGCDGGSTKFQYTLADETGRVLAHRKYPGLNAIAIGKEAFMRGLSEQVTDMLRQANTAPEAITHAMFAITGYGEDKTSVPDTQAAVSGALGHGRYTLANDSVAGWSGALLGQPGIAVASGTGSVAYGEDGRGGKARAGGWSILYGDEGSAYWVAVQALNAFFRQADGRLPRTRLYDAMMDIFDVTDPLHLPAEFHARFEQNVSAIAGFQRQVLALATAGDDCARGIYIRAAKELAALAQGLVRRLSFAADAPLLVSYAGGLFMAGDVIVAPFEEAIRQMGASPVRPRFGPAAGAVCYAARDFLTRDDLEAMYGAVDEALQKEDTSHAG